MLRSFAAHPPLQKRNDERLTFRSDSWNSQDDVLCDRRGLIAIIQRNVLLLFDQSRPQASPLLNDINAD